MPLFLVGTRFQAVMALSIARDTGRGYDVAVLAAGSGPGQADDDVALARLLAGARTARRIDRTMPPLALQAALIKAAGKTLSGDRTVVTAAIGHPLVMALFRLIPPLRCETFDEGGYNVGADSPFRRPERRTPYRRLMFPRGVVAYAGRRSARHFTAFAPERNLFAHKAVAVAIDWDSLLAPEDVAALPAAPRSVFVLPCLRDLALPDATRRRILAAAAAADVALRHPREKDLVLANAVSLRSPAEAVIAALASRGPLTVRHFRSTIGHSLAHWPGVDLFDIGAG